MREERKLVKMLVVTAILCCLFCPTVGTAHSRSRAQHTHRVAAHKRYPWQTRPNPAANQALAEACYLDVPNNKPERYDDVNRALESGAKPDIDDGHGFTPLMHEAQW